MKGPFADLVLSSFWGNMIDLNYENFHPIQKFHEHVNASYSCVINPGDTIHFSQMFE